LGNAVESRNALTAMKLRQGTASGWVALELARGWQRNKGWRRLNGREQIHGPIEGVRPVDSVAKKPHPKRLTQLSLPNPRKDFHEGDPGSIGTSGRPDPNESPLLAIPQHVAIGP
jgi:hypothetical protein